MWAARVSRAAADVGVKVPLQTMPFACTARVASWRP